MTDEIPTTDDEIAESLMDLLCLGFDLTLCVALMQKLYDVPHKVTFHIWDEIVKANAPPTDEIKALRRTASIRRLRGHIDKAMITEGEMPAAMQMMQHKTPLLDDACRYDYERPDSAPRVLRLAQAIVPDEPKH